MTEQLTIASFSVPVLYTPDVCVVGAGAAGVSAAMGAARCGLKVLLVEKYGFCGGATVAGLSGTICGLFSSGSTIEQIVFGFADEFYAALKRRNGAGEPITFGKTKLVVHDSLVWKETADDLLEDAGCQVLYHVNFIKAFLNDVGAVEYLLMKGPEGQFAIKPKYVIDASGDAEVVHSISGETSFGNNGEVQSPTMIFKMGGVAMKTFLQLAPSFIDAEIIKAHHSDSYYLPRHHVYLFPMPNGNEVICNMTRITYPDGKIPSGISSKDLSYAEVEGRRQAREYARFLKDKIQGFSQSYMIDTGTQIGIRQTRSIKGMATLTNDDVLTAKKVDGAASFSAWPIEAHGAGDLKIVYLENDFYSIPFETLLPVKTENVLVAGRCMSAEHEALASARVTAQCFGMGYAAGAACGLIHNENILTKKVTGVDVEAWMKESGLATAYQRNSKTVFRYMRPSNH